MCRRFGPIPAGCARGGDGALRMNRTARCSARCAGAQREHQAYLRRPLPIHRPATAGPAATSAPWSVPSPSPAKLTDDSTSLAPPGPAMPRTCSMDRRTSAPLCVRAPAEKSTPAVAGWFGAATSNCRRSVETRNEVRLLNCTETTTLVVAVSAADTGEGPANRPAATTPIRAVLERMLLGISILVPYRAAA